MPQVMTSTTRQFATVACVKWADWTRIGGRYCRCENPTWCGEVWVAICVVCRLWWWSLRRRWWHRVVGDTLTWCRWWWRLSSVSHDKWSFRLWRGLSNGTRRSPISCWWINWRSTAWHCTARVLTSTGCFHTLLESFTPVRFARCFNVSLALRWFWSRLFAIFL